jgi:hypothetical protein
MSEHWSARRQIKGRGAHPGASDPGASGSVGGGLARHAAVKCAARSALLTAAVLSVAALCASLPRTASADTQWYAVGMAHLATYSDGKFGPGTNCPHGGNGQWAQQQIQILTWRYHYSAAQAKQLLAGRKGEELVTNRGLKDGKPAPILWYPLSIPRHPEELVVPHGKAYGFDLDGKGASSPNAMVDPETHQRDVENNLFRVLGCYSLYNMNLPLRPTYEESVDIDALAVMPAWLISVTGADLSKDGPVTVTFAKALEHPLLGANGKPLQGQTYTLDPSTQSFGTLQGKIVNGELIATGGEISWEGETPQLTVLDLTHTHLRLKKNPDGSLGGYLGGFEPWMDYWSMEAASESFDGADLSTVYYDLRALADADPDPVTGMNRRISATYRLDDLEPVSAVAVPYKYRPPVNLRSQNLGLISRYVPGVSGAGDAPRIAER